LEKAKERRCGLTPRSTQDAADPHRCYTDRELLFADLRAKLAGKPL
jgi:hypothetical protein